MTTIVHPGRKYVVFVIAVFVLSSISTITLTNLTIGFDRLGTQIVRLALTIGLSVMLYQGRNWARILTAFLAGLAAIAGIFGGIGLFATTGHPVAFLLIIQASLYFVCLIILFFSSAVRSYFQPI